MNKLESDWKKCQAVAVPALTHGEDPDTAGCIEYGMKHAFFLGAQALFIGLGDAVKSGDIIELQKFIGQTAEELGEWQKAVHYAAGESLADPQADIALTGCPRCLHPLDDLGGLHRCPRCYFTRLR